MTHRFAWVLNLDADEFLVPVDRSLSVREALEATPLHLNAFTVPVVNLIGPAGWLVGWECSGPDDGGAFEPCGP